MVGVIKNCHPVGTKIGIWIRPFPIVFTYGTHVLIGLFIKCQAGLCVEFFLYQFHISNLAHNLKTPAHQNNRMSGTVL